MPARSFGKFCRNWRTYVKERLRHPEAFALWPQCLDVDGFSRDQLLELQQRKLQSLLTDVIAHVPFYRDWAKAKGCRPGDTIRLDDLPIVTKQDFRNDLEAFQSEAYPRGDMENERTSGSTGEPFRFRVYKRGSDYSYCCLWRGLGRWSLRTGDRRVYVWGRRPQLGPVTGKSKLAGAREWFRDWAANTLTIDAHTLDGDYTRRALSRIRDFRPVYLHGYASALYQLARESLDGGPALGGLGIRAAVSESEKLFDFQREVIEKAFGCAAVEHYGSVEFGMISQQDTQGHMRINEDHCIVEQSDAGEAIITNLHAPAFPFIRYKLGDMVELAERVEEGLPYRGIAKLAGRKADEIPLSGGRRVHGFVLMYPISVHLDYIRQYQVHQLALDQFRIRLALAKPLPAEIRERILREFGQIVGADAKVEIDEVQSLPKTQSGKFRWVISDVASGPPTQETEVGGRSSR